MALTEAVRLRLEGIGFEKLFADNEAKWHKMADEARHLMAGQVQGGEPTVDDIKKILEPMLELDPDLRKFLEQNRLTQKYWVGHFTDYVLHKVYKPKLLAMKKEKSK